MFFESRRELKEFDVSVVAIEVRSTSRGRCGGCPRRWGRCACNSTEGKAFPEDSFLNFDGVTQDYCDTEIRIMP